MQLKHDENQVLLESFGKGKNLKIPVRVSIYYYQMSLKLPR